MQLKDFFYELPPELIAQHPLERRDHSRLLVLDRTTGEIRHRYFYDITGYLQPGDALVLNDTRVFKARIRGKKETGGTVEILLVREIEGGTWEALVHSSKRLKIGGKIFFDRVSYAEVIGKSPGRCRVTFSEGARETVRKYGIVPLPHYIKRGAEARDENTYQTVYARPEGSIAAPTAGLHFTPGLLEEIERAGVKVCRLTLHIGPGTFKPIRTAEVERHEMDAEYAEISSTTADEIKTARRVFGVGTSVTRTLESVVPVRGYSGFTDLFIYPGHRFRCVGHLVTNFHLPGSTPLLLVCAFAGRELIFKAYREAVRERYRFLSYGDSMLII